MASSPLLAMLRGMLCAVVLAGVMLDASATSCVGGKQRFYFTCGDRQCTPQFTVVLVPGLGPCSGLPEVEDIDPRVAAFLGPVIQQAHGMQASGLYAVSVPTSTWMGFKGDPLERFTLAMQESAIDTCPACALSAWTVQQAVAALNGANQGKAFVQLATTATAETVRSRRSELESEARKAYLIDMSMRVAYWLSSLVALVVLVYSAALYFSRFYQPMGHAGGRGLWTPLLLQLGVALSAPLAFMVFPLMFWPGAFLLPAVGVITLTQGWVYLRAKVV